MPIDEPVTYLGQFWIYRGVEIRNKNNPLETRVVLAVHCESSRDLTMVRILKDDDVIEYLPISDIEDNWQATGKRRAPTRLP